MPSAAWRVTTRKYIANFIWPGTLLQPDHSGRDALAQVIEKLLPALDAFGLLIGAVLAQSPAIFLLPGAWLVLPGEHVATAVKDQRPAA